MPKTVVLVYSGGLDTSVAIPMMREDYGFDRIVTVTVDVGQPAEDVKTAEERARALGTEHYTADAKAEFVERILLARRPRQRRLPGLSRSPRPSPGP